MFQDSLHEAWREYIQIMQAKQWDKEARGEINAPEPTTYKGTEILKPNNRLK